MLPITCRSPEGCSLVRWGTGDRDSETDQVEFANRSPVVLVSNYSYLEKLPTIGACRKGYFVVDDDISTPLHVGTERSPQRLRQVIERLFRDGSVVAQLDGTTRQIFPIGITNAEGEALRAWVMREKAISTIEIGLAYGISALFIFEGLLANGVSNACHVVLDPHQQGFANCGLQVLNEAGVGELVEHHARDSEIALPQLLAEGRQFDFAFVDGNHRFDGVFVDLIYLGKLVRPGGIIFLDDYQLQSVSRAVSFCRNNLAWTVEEASPNDELHQWVVLRTPLVPLQRSYDHFVEF